MKQLKKAFSTVTFSVMFIMAAALVIPAVSAQTVGALSITDGANSARGNNQTDCLVDDSGATCTDEPIFKTITNVPLFIVGAISVIMLVIGGIRYTISGGDSGQVKSAKDTILYAIIGIIVSLLAFAVVNFVLSSFAK